MLNKYYKYLPWLILGAIGSYQSATYYARTAFDVFYLTTIFLIVYIALLFLHENYLKSVERFLLKPDAVAKKIIKIIGKNKRELNLPMLLNLAHKFYTLFPKLADKLAGETFNYK